MFTPKELQDKPPLISEGPTTKLERMYIEEFLKGKGYQVRDLRKLPREEARRLMTEACIYASTKLAEVEARAKFVHNIHYP